MYNIILATGNFGVAVLYLGVLISAPGLTPVSTAVGLGFTALALATGFQLLKGDK